MSRFRPAAISAALVLLLAAPADAADARARITYDVYVGGVRMLEVQSNLALAAESYDVDLSAHVVGIAATFSDWRSNVRSMGALDGPKVRPASNTVQRINGDSDKTTTITFLGGGRMDVVIVPSSKPKREQTIPPRQLVDALDPLSGVVSILQALRVGSAACSGRVPVFDGRRLYVADLADGGSVALAKTDLGIYGGAAQRCTLTLTPAVGDLDFGDAKPSGRATDYMQGGGGQVPGRRVIDTWLASPGRGLPAVPVRIESESPWGRVVVHLRAIEGRGSGA